MDEIQNTSGEKVEAAAPIVESDSSQQSSDGQAQPAVPVHVVQSLRSENHQLKENFKILSEHLELLKANQARASGETQQENFSRANDEEVVTVGELKKYAHQFQRQQKMELEELKMAQMYPDYPDTIKKYLPQVLQEDPELRYEIENAKNPFKMAYRLAKNSSAYQDEHKKTKRNEDAQRILSNSEKTGNLSAVGSTSPITQASRWKSMTDDEFRKVMNKNMSLGAY